MLHVKKLLGSKEHIKGVHFCVYLENGCLRAFRMILSMVLSWCTCSAQSKKKKKKKIQVLRDLLPCNPIYSHLRSSLKFNIKVTVVNPGK